MTGNRRIEVTCIGCGIAQFRRKDAISIPYRCLSCAVKKRLQEHTGNIGRRSSKGGRVVTKRGYVLIKLYPGDPFYPMADKAGYVYEHRLVMAKSLNRCLDSVEIVHHDHTPRDVNQLSKLELLPSHREHGKLHNPITFIERSCAHCGRVNFYKPWQISVNKSGAFFCDVKCRGQYQRKFGNAYSRRICNGES